jgi:Right handed beta helix region
MAAPMRRRLALAAVFAAPLLAAGHAAAATFYVSPDGSDAAAGTSPASAWRSVGKVDATPLRPGDVVLFKGGATFPGLLEPQGSGASGSPIAFGSYGGGRANISGGIQLASQSWLSFDGLRVDTGAWRTAGDTRGIRTSDSGSGVQNVVVENSQFTNVAIGLLFSNHRDRNWAITNNVIRYTRDSGILIFDPNVPNEIGASHLTFTANQILDTGLDRSITWKKHGVYDIGTDLVWRNNVIRRFSEGGFSLRARGNTLIGNTIADGPYAIYYSPYDSTAGKTTIANNKISNVTQGAITLDSSGNVPDVESFVVAGNSIAAKGTSPGIRILGTSGSISLVNNVVSVERGPLFRIDRLPGGGLTEQNNLWWSTTGTPSWGFLGKAFFKLADYVAGSGRGTGDRFSTLP